MSITAIDPASVHFNTSGWLQVNAPSSPRLLYLSATPSGCISMNERLIQEIRDSSPTLTFQFFLQPDGKLLALYPTAEDSQYRFPKSGRIKDESFTRHLVSLGISLPARYHMAWNENAGAWVGCLEEIATPKAAALERSLSGSRRRKR